MAPDDATLTREQRLAAKLRENLKRRKAQARAQGEERGPEQTRDDPLPNMPPKS